MLQLPLEVYFGVVGLLVVFVRAAVVLVSPATRPLLHSASTCSIPVPFA